MQIPDEIRKCVVFFAYKTKAETRFAGTAFFVQYPFESDPSKAVTYLVTARHVLEGIKRRCVENHFYIRVNLKGSGATMIPVQLDGVWTYHPDERVDIAVAMMTGIKNSGLDYVAVGKKTLVTREFIDQQKVGIGNEVFISGLFTSHYGKTRNIPIVRVGNIAAMPEEPVSTKQGEMSAFLVECRSIGGLSGSPVFVHHGPIRVIDGKASFGKEWSFKLLGLMHGHWNFPVSGDAPLHDGSFDEEKLNSGIGVVVPSQAILDVLESDEFRSNRVALAKQLEQPSAL